MEAKNRAIVRPPSVRPHGALPRGFEMDTRSVLFEGRFGRLFGALTPADFGQSDAESTARLEALAARLIHEQDCPKDQPDDEESGIPAAYTYLGQFVDHDLTFDPASSLMRQNDPDALVDFRTPRLDLDCIYGRGRDDQPYLYDGEFFLEGDSLSGNAVGTSILGARDLPRPARHAADGRPDNAFVRRAIIGDPRNDENTIVSQLQGLALRFHNRFRRDNTNLTFEQVQEQVRFHYQWVVTTDFLPRVVALRVLARVLPHLSERGRPSTVVANPPSLRFFQPRKEAFIPLEFAAAAYRFGHSMVRPGYRLNDEVGVLPIFPLSDSRKCPDMPREDLRGFRAMNPAWAIDWARLLDIEPRPAGDEHKAEDTPENRTRMQLAYKIDPSLVDPLAHLPSSVAGDVAPVFHSLAARNLVRGWRMRLPSGQAIANAIGAVPLDDSEILLGSAAEDQAKLDSIGQVEGFARTCPLWLYVLAEAAHDSRVAPERETVRTSGGDRQITTPKLGDVGGTILAETFGGIMLDDRNSFWNVAPKWRPSLACDGEFTLREFVRYALGQ